MEKECLFCKTIFKKTSNISIKYFLFFRKYCSVSCALRNRTISDATRLKHSIIAKRLGLVPPKFSELSLEKQKSARLKHSMYPSPMLGKKHSIESKLKNSEAHKGSKSGSWKGGLPKCKTCNKQLGCYRSKFCVFHKSVGELSGNWKGGKETEKVRDVINNQRRRARKKSNGGSYTYQEWEQLINNFNYTCLCCKKCEPEIKLTADHIIPISKGGKNDISNIQPLCVSCNSKKNTNIISYIPLFQQPVNVMGFKK